MRKPAHKGKHVCNFFLKEIIFLGCKQACPFYLAGKGKCFLFAPASQKTKSNILLRLQILFLYNNPDKNINRQSVSYTLGNIQGGPLQHITAHRHNSCFVQIGTVGAINYLYLARQVSASNSATVPVRKPL